jgi:hypothetical protein
MTLVLFLAAFLAGAMNAVAGGGTFVTFPALLVMGLNPLAANVTCTVALFPGVAWAGWSGRALVADAPQVTFRTLLWVSLAGGLVGAVLLVLTPAAVFARLVPWLVLFATSLFAWGSFGRKASAPALRLHPTPAAAIQFCIGIYGGYFGGGIGFLMLAALAVAGMAVRPAVATKTVLAAAMNAAAVVVFLFSPAVAWGPAVVVAVAAIAGGQGGVWLVRRVNERVLRGVVVAIGVALTVGLFVRG